MNSVRNRLALLFFVITAAAVGFIYLYVVPQLRTSLTAEKLRRLETVAASQSPSLDDAMHTRRLAAARARSGPRDRPAHRRPRHRPGGPDRRHRRPRPRSWSPTPSSSAPRPSPTTPRPGAPSAGERTASAVEGVGGERLGQTAVPLIETASRAGSPSSPPASRDVDDNVALIRRQILIAGGIALLAALGAGYLVAGAHARRLRRLEEAAEKIADGDFSTPIPVDSGDEVGQLAMTFNEMQKRLATLDSARKEFIANASHELRTPIFSLSGFVELLEDDDPDPAARAEFVRTMREQVDRLTKLTVDLLDLSKLDADAIDIRRERVRLADVARRVAEEFGPRADSHGSPIEVADGNGAAASADPDRVAQIMRILIDNALTHTPPGTAITVHTKAIDAGNPADRTASLTVTDDGPGIDAHSRERVFERFFTGDEVSGSGLGLAIGRELALRMGGSLELRTRRGRTEFELRLPAVRTRS